MIPTVCVASPEVLRRHHDDAASRGLPWLAAHPEVPEPLAVVGGGQSAEDALETLLTWPGDIMAINGAYDWLLSYGVTADWVFAIDPQPGLADILGNPRCPTRYIVGSCCDGSVLDVLAGFPVTLCRVRQGHDRGEPGDIPGGPSAMTRAPVVAAVLGYRSVYLFGADCCFQKQRRHIYDADRPMDPLTVVCGGRIWQTNITMLAQAQYLAEMIPAMCPGISVAVVGDSLASAMLINKGQFQA